MTTSGSFGSFEPVITQVTAMTGGALMDSQKEEITRRSFDALVEMYAPLYEREISLDDLHKMNEFYQTPAGRRIAVAQANMVNSSMDVAQQWSVRVQQIIQDVLAQ
ncbi:MAG: DUF2059 domain-containing protein [Rikenellaceae bacterium]|nr:DUF2059 domain-containing protein [Rikenellaceae bacterium]